MNGRFDLLLTKFLQENKETQRFWLQTCIFLDSIRAKLDEADSGSVSSSQEFNVTGA